MTDPTPLWRTTEHADLAVLEQAWGAHRLSQILGAALGSYNRRGNVDARTAGAVLGVTDGTIRRWLRAGVPTSKMQAVIDLVRPPQGAFELEHSDLIVARQNLAIVTADPQKGADLWGHKGWLDRHDPELLPPEPPPAHTKQGPGRRSPHHRLTLAAGFSSPPRTWWM